MPIKRATEAFLDAVARELGRVLDAEVSWHPSESGPAEQDLHWWSAQFREEDIWVYAGADAEDVFPVLSACLEKLLSRQVGPGKVLGQPAHALNVPEDETSVTFEIQGDGSTQSLFCVLNAGIEAALAASPAPALSKKAASGNSLDMLMHVEVPVSVSFGSTRVRMRDLLGLTAGSVVELDQSLGAQVDVRVNDSLIARGEVVAVDGNYAVRVLEIVSQTEVLGKHRAR